MPDSDSILRRRSRARRLAVPSRARRSHWSFPREPWRLAILRADGRAHARQHGGAHAREHDGAHAREYNDAHARGDWRRATCRRRRRSDYQSREINLTESDNEEESHVGRARKSDRVERMRIVYRA